MKKTAVLVYITRDSEEIHPAIYYLKAYASRKLVNVDFVTLVYPHGKAASAIVREISGMDPSLVGFSTYVWNGKKTLGIVRALKQKSPDIPIVLGGPEASYNAGRIMAAESGVDVIAVDEGENTLAQLSEHYIYGKKNLPGIRGILYKDNGEVKSTGPASLLDLNTVRSPFAGGCMPDLGDKIVAYESSRGCPFRCAYCSYNMGSYARMRFFPIRQVLSDISCILEEEPKKLNIVDDNFNIHEPRAAKILKRIRKSVKRTTVTLFLRADVWKISEGFVRLLAHENIFCTIGVQSLNPETLAVANRIHNRENLDRNIELLRKHGVNFILQFIVGLPGDRYRDVQRMIDWAFQYAPDDIHLQTLRINPQTEFEKNSRKHGITYRKTPPYTIRKTKTMTPGQLEKSQLLALRFESVYKNRALREDLLHCHMKTHMPASKLIEQSMGGA